MGRRLKHQFANNIYLRAIKSYPISLVFEITFQNNFLPGDHGQHLRRSCYISSKNVPYPLYSPPPPSPPSPKNPQKIPKNCDVFLETSFTISFFFLFSYLGNNRDLYQLPLDVFDGVPLSYLWVLAYSYFEKGCRKKCTRQYRKVLWVVLSSLFFKEI